MTPESHDLRDAHSESDAPEWASRLLFIEGGVWPLEKGSPAIEILRDILATISSPSTDPLHGWFREVLSNTVQASLSWLQDMDTLDRLGLPIPEPIREATRTIPQFLELLIRGRHIVRGLSTLYFEYLKRHPDLSLIRNTLPEIVRGALDYQWQEAFGAGPSIDWSSEIMHVIARHWPIDALTNMHILLKKELQIPPPLLYQTVVEIAHRADPHSLNDIRIVLDVLSRDEWNARRVVREAVRDLLERVLETEDPRVCRIATERVLRVKAWTTDSTIPDRIDGCVQQVAESRSESAILFRWFFATAPHRLWRGGLAQRTLHWLTSLLMSLCTGNDYELIREAVLQVNSWESSTPSPDIVDSLLQTIAMGIPQNPLLTYPLLHLLLALNRSHKNYKSWGMVRDVLSKTMFTALQEGSEWVIPLMDSALQMDSSKVFHILVPFSEPLENYTTRLLQTALLTLRLLDPVIGQHLSVREVIHAPDVKTLIHLARRASSLCSTPAMCSHILNGPIALREVWPVIMRRALELGNDGLIATTVSMFPTIRENREGEESGLQEFIEALRQLLEDHPQIPTSLLGCAAELIKSHWNDPWVMPSLRQLRDVVLVRLLQSQDTSDTIMEK